MATPKVNHEEKDKWDQFIRSQEGIKLLEDLRELVDASKKLSAQLDLAMKRLDDIIFRLNRWLENPSGQYNEYAIALRAYNEAWDDIRRSPVGASHTITHVYHEYRLLYGR